jgi:hypothetical protein
MRYAPVTKIEGTDPAAEKPIEGPIVKPGTYHVTLKVGSQELTQTFRIVVPGNVPASQEELDAQADLLLRIHRQLDRTVRAINRMRDLRAQLDGWSKRAKSIESGEEIAKSASDLKEKVLEIEKTLLVPDLRPGWADNLNQGVRLYEKLSSLIPVVQLGDYRPTDAAEAVFQDLSARIDEQIARLDRLVSEDLAALNAQIRSANLDPILAV